MKVLVTGGAGFIGSHCVKRLLDRGDSVVCLDNFNDYYDPQRKEENVADFLVRAEQGDVNFELVRGDILDEELLDALAEKHSFDKVLHLAARAGVRPSIEQPLLYQQVNVEGTLKILEMARKYGINDVVMASSSSVYGCHPEENFAEHHELTDPISPYAASKRATELFAAVYHNLFGMNVTCLRFFTVYGPGNRPDMAVYLFTDRIARGESIARFGDGSTERDYTYVEDIVSGVVASLDRPMGYEVINLGNNSPVKLRDLIGTIEKLLGKKAVIVEKPLQDGDVPRTYADIEKAKRLLDFEPKTGIEDGLAKVIEWYNKKFL
jgi:UDP-glucuronate 4-epimerase